MADTKQNGGTGSPLTQVHLVLLVLLRLALLFSAWFAGRLAYIHSHSLVSLSWLGLLIPTLWALSSLDFSFLG